MRKQLIMKIFKNTLVSILSALIVIMTIYGGYTIYASDYAFDSPGMDYANIKSLYHREMNSLFNEKVSQLVDILDDKNIDPFSDDRFLTPTEGTSGSDGDNGCSKDNLSTFCVSLQALDRYLAYVNRLNMEKSTLPSSDAEIKTYEFYLSLTKARNTLIDKEIEDAKTVMSAVLNAYNEFRLAYPLHKKYLDIIDDLAKFRLKLKLIKRQVRDFPLRFIDASSDACK